jgi:hypothetical protein
MCIRQHLCSCSPSRGAPSRSSQKSRGESRDQPTMKLPRSLADDLFTVDPAIAPLEQQGVIDPKRTRTTGLSEPDASQPLTSDPSEVTAPVRFFSPCCTVKFSHSCSNVLFRQVSSELDCFWPQVLWIPTYSYFGCIRKVHNLCCLTMCSQKSESLTLFRKACSHICQGRPHHLPCVLMLRNSQRCSNVVRLWQYILPCSAMIKFSVESVRTTVLLQYIIDHKEYDFCIR